MQLIIIYAYFYFVLGRREHKNSQAKIIPNIDEAIIHILNKSYNTRL